MTKITRDDILIMGIAYAIGGAVVLAIMGFAGYRPIQGDEALLECITVMVFWPVFAIKYIGVGIVMLFGALFSML